MTGPEFSRLVRLVPEPREVVLEPDAAERAALAARFGILGIGAVTARLRLEPEAGGTIRARGRLEAAVEQRLLAAAPNTATAPDSKWRRPL